MGIGRLVRSASLSVLLAASIAVACAPEAPRQRLPAPAPTPYVLAALSKQEMVGKFVNGVHSVLQHTSPVLYSEERFKREEALILKLAEASVQTSIDEFVERDNKHRSDEEQTGRRMGFSNYYDFSPNLVGTRPDDIPVWLALYYDQRGGLYRVTVNAYLAEHLNDSVSKVMPEALRRFTGRTNTWYTGTNWIRTDLNWDLMKELPYVLFPDLPQGLEWMSVNDKQNAPAPPTRTVTAMHKDGERSLYLQVGSKGDVLYDLTFMKR